MKKLFFLFFIFSLLLTPLYQAEAQSTNTTTVTFNSSDLPQWVKDMRRFDIISFGMFPFSMFFVTTVSDMIRWRDANNFSMTEEGRRYAPWPAKSAGAYEMTNDEYKRTILMAAGVSVGVALLDLMIVNIKRNSERRRVESLPSSTFEIERKPYGVIPETEDPADGAGEPPAE